MLALKLVRELRRRVQPLGLTVRDAVDRLEAGLIQGLWKRWGKSE
jgi:hypothetical protein